MGEQSTTWTPSRIGVLQELWGTGLSAKEIAARLGGGITRNAVIGKAHRLGLSSRPSPIKQKLEKPASSSQIKTRMTSPKAMGLRRDVVSANGAYGASMVRAPSAYKDEGETRRIAARAADTGSYNGASSSRIFKPAQASSQTQAQQCRWPMGDPLKAGFHFCESMAIPGVPYCYDHACVAYQGSKKKSPSAPREEIVVIAETADAAPFGAVNNS